MEMPQNRFFFLNAQFFAGMSMILSKWIIKPYTSRLDTSRKSAKLLNLLTSYDHGHPSNHFFWVRSTEPCWKPVAAAGPESAWSETLGAPGIQVLRHRRRDHLGWGSFFLGERFCGPNTFVHM